MGRKNSTTGGGKGETTARGIAAAGDGEVEGDREGEGDGDVIHRGRERSTREREERLRESGAVGGQNWKTEIFRNVTEVCLKTSSDL